MSYAQSYGFTVSDEFPELQAYLDTIKAQGRKFGLNEGQVFQFALATLMQVYPDGLPAFSNLTPNMPKRATTPPAGSAPVAEPATVTPTEPVTQPQTVTETPKVEEKPAEPEQTAEELALAEKLLNGGSDGF